MKILDGKYDKEVKDVLWLMLLQGLNYVLPLVVWPYLMVVLGAEKFGYISFSQSLNMYLMLLVDFGFNMTAAKQLALVKDDQVASNRIFSAVMTDKMYLLIPTALVLVVLSFIPQYAAYRQTMWIMFGMVIGNAFSFTWVFLGYGKVRQMSIISTLCRLLILPLVFVVVKDESDYLWAAAIQTIVPVMASLVIGTLVYKMGFRWHKTTWQEQKWQLKDSWMICLSNAASGVYAMLLTIILAYFVSADEVGRYGAAEKIMRVICTLMISTVIQAFYSRASILGKENRGQGKAMMRRLYIASTVIMSSVFIVLLIGSDWICNFLGKEYIAAAPILRILSIVPLFVSIGAISGELGLIAMGGEQEKKSYRNSYCTAAIVALLAVSVLTPLWGAKGAAISLLLAEICVTAGMTGGYVRMVKHEKK